MLTLKTFRRLLHSIFLITLYTSFLPALCYPRPCNETFTFIFSGFVRGSIAWLRVAKPVLTHTQLIPALLNH